MMTENERQALVRSFLGKVMQIRIDRPIGFVHRKNEKTLIYPINYGYVPNVLGGDGEELDVYLMDINVPVEEYTGRIIGIVYRRNDVEDKLIMAPVDVTHTAEEIAQAIRFQEKYYDSYIEALQ